MNVDMPMTFGQAILVFVLTIIAFAFLISVAILLGEKNEIKLADDKLKKKAKARTVILLTCEQYLALHDAAPEEYPLRPEKLEHRLCSYSSNIRMLHDEYSKLRNIAYEAQRAEHDVAQRATCMEELKKMHGLLADRIEALDKQNQETTVTIAEQTSGLFSSMKVQLEPKEV